MRINYNKLIRVKKENILLNLKRSLFQNIIVLEDSLLCCGEGSIVLTSDVLAVPVQTLDVRKFIFNILHFGS